MLVPRATLCLATTNCLDQDASDPHDVPHPPDCWHIRNHLPFLPIIGPDDPMGTLKTLDPSTPFFPNAAFYHGTCGIQIEFQNYPWWENLPLRATKASALEAWTHMRAGVVSVIENCIDVGRTGYAYGDMADTKPTVLSYAVIVSSFSFSEDPRRVQGRVMYEGEPPRSPFNSVFEMTYYDV